MNRRGHSFFSRIAVVGASAAIAIFIGAPGFAQQKPIVIEARANASAVKAQTTISKSGSYILNRNLTNSSKNGSDEVLITASNVTIDLQGFSIISTNNLTGAGIEVMNGLSNVVIRNGIITGFGGPAIIGENNTNVSAIVASGNGSGITCGTGCLVSNNIIQGNTGLGLSFADATSGYVGNMLQGNNSGGVQVTGGTSLSQNVCNGIAC